jgi:hypothetical protein
LGQYQERWFNFTTDQVWRLEVEQRNTGGPGFLNLALVRKSSEPSWASLQGEWHHVKIKRKWTGEQHMLELGNVVNGTLMLEYGFLNLEGYPSILQTRNISLEASESTIEYESTRVGVHIKVRKQGAALSVSFAHSEVSSWQNIMDGTVARFLVSTDMRCASQSMSIL